MLTQVSHDGSHVFLGDGCVPDRQHSLNQRIPVVFVSPCPLGQVLSDLSCAVTTPAVHGEQDLSFIIGQKSGELLIGIGLQRRGTILIGGAGGRAKVLAQVSHDRRDVFLGDGRIPDRDHLFNQNTPEAFISPRPLGNGLSDSGGAMTARTILDDQCFSLTIRQKVGQLLTGLFRLLSPSRDHQRYDQENQDDPISFSGCDQNVAPLLPRIVPGSLPAGRQDRAPDRP